MRPPRLVDWAAAGAAEDWQMGKASAEKAITATGGAAEDGPGAPLVITHGPVAEVLYDGAEFDVDVGNAAWALGAAEAARARPPRPSNWGAMSRSQKKNWKQQGERPR